MFKKLVTSLLSVVLLLGLTVGTAFAETPLNETVDSLIGTPYKWAGTTEKGFDCSGFTMYLFAQFNISLPHSSAAQSKQGTTIKKDELRPGDLVFFNTSGKGISHVGVYMGDGKFAHSASDKGVILTNLEDAYYKKRYVTATRILSDAAYNKLTEEPVKE